MHRSIRVTALAAITAAPFCLGLPSVSLAQTADTSNQAPLEEVVVTGSLLRRTDTETPSPIQVVSAEDIQNSGYTSVSEVLRSLSANGAGTLSQSFNSAFAAGGSGVALRGLTVGGTLTLIDGERMVGYPLTDDGERNFVDVTAIPFNAVEQVQVLKDGASAEYGSDAIAGVVNIILKKQFQGAQFEVEGGESGHTDGQLLHLTGIWGVGDLGADGFNAYVTAEYRHQEQILQSNRSGLWTNQNWIPYGGVNTTPGAGTNPFTPYPGSTTGYLINPDPENGLPAETFLPGCTAAQQAADQCTFQFKGLQLQPTTSSANVLAKITKNIGANWQSVTTLSIFQTHADQANPGYFGTGYPSGFTIIAYPANGAPTPFIYPVITVPTSFTNGGATNLNPYGAPAPLVYDFAELGLGYTNTKNNTYRFMEALTGHVGDWEVGGFAGLMHAQLTQDYSGYLSPFAAQNALNNGYVLGSGTENPTLAPEAFEVDSSGLEIFNVHASGPIAMLPGGPLSLGVGAEWYEKLLNAPPSPSSADGMQSMNDAWAVGSQADTAAFAELGAPILKQLEVNLSSRYDQYNTAAGGLMTPKAGVKFTPIPELAFRGTYGKGFRAPSIAETNSGLAFGAAAVADPILCPNGPAAPGAFPSQCAIELTGVQPGNPNLKPEKTTNYTLGVVIEPTKNFNIAVDYYDIKINQDIISAFEAGGLGFTGLTSLVRFPNTVSLPQVSATGVCCTNAQTPVGLALYEGYPYINGTADETNGIDIDIQSHWDLGAAGKASVGLSATHLLTYKLEALGTDYELAGTHGPSGVSGDTGNPKDRATLTVTWDKGPASVTASVNYISSFSVTDPSASQFTCDEALGAAFSLEYGPRTTDPSTFPSSFCTVASFTDVDLYAHYDITSHLQAHLSVLNVLDKGPPLDMATYGGGGGAAYDPALHQQGAVGRFFTVGFTFTL